MSVKIKRTHKQHVEQIATEYGISTQVAERLIKGYISDLQDSLKRKESISVPGLFSITVREGEGGIELRGTVSTVIKREVRGY